MTIWTDRLNNVKIRAEGGQVHISVGQKFSVISGLSKKVLSPYTQKIPEYSRRFL